MTAAQVEPRLSLMHVGGTTDQVAWVRRWVAAQLAGVDDDLVERAVLVASELCSNAVVHTASGAPGGCYTVCVRVHPGWVRLDVVDAGPADAPRRVEHDDGADDGPTACGRGLLLVAALAADWWHRTDPHTHTRTTGASFTRGT